MAATLLLSALGGARQANAQPVPTTGPPDAAPPAFVAKKDRTYQAKTATQATVRAAWIASLDKRIGRAPSKIINLYNTWTKEYIAVEADGRASIAPENADAFLRCHFTNEPTTMDDRLVATVLKAARHFSVNRVDIVSGFRSPKYNLLLRKKGREVARDSQHTHGNAVDFRLPGIAVKALHAWAKSQRMGGVGLYKSSGFVHMDTARIRYWGGE